MSNILSEQSTDYDFAITNPALSDSSINNSSSTSSSTKTIAAETTDIRIQPKPLAKVRDRSPLKEIRLSKTNTSTEDSIGSLFHGATKDNAKHQNSPEVL